MIKLIAFDADDTLWENENFFFEVHEQYAEFMTKYVPKEEMLQHLHETEMRNLQPLGYGIKAFTISLMEAALSITNNKIDPEDLSHILQMGKGMIERPVHLLDGVTEVLEKLQGRYKLITITKGDLLDQNRKLRKAGLADYFTDFIVVNEKDESTYTGILEKYRVDPKHFFMVGNSMKSDVIPALEIGAHAAHIPFRYTWQHELAEHNGRYENLYELKHMCELLNIDLLKG
ncbi:HAD family hydrolase [Puteibacter caeruleilacunae]|nr:HAD family hydrolase [Puteibacter caeruleilacunae]